LNEKTNYLFILVDQARADFLGCYGNDAIKTPNIDALAKRGSLFERLYVANPFCMPARSAIMTGRMPSVNGARTNGVPLNAHSRTFVEQLLTNGYDTALIGKCHLQNMTGWQRAYTPPLQKIVPWTKMATLNSRHARRLPAMIMRMKILFFGKMIPPTT
jgi:arylsulfatase A-like enzyme